MGKNDKATKAKGSSSGVKSDLKANNAGYSTTNSRGETTYYKSSRDAEAGNALKTVKAGTNVPVMTPQNMTATSPANIPTKPTASDPGSLILSAVPGYTQDANGMYQAEKSVAGTSNDMSGTMSIFGKYISSLEAPKSQAEQYLDTYGISEREVSRDFRQAQRDVNSYTSQLNNIVAKQQADLLRVRGAGSENGVTEAVYGGQQATINREAAIAALPVQASLEAAQGNLEIAKGHVDKLFELRTNDADRQYNYRQKLLDSALTVATTVEQNRLNALKTQEDRKYQEKLSNIQTMNEWAKLAVETGQSGLVSRIMSLDPSSPTFATSFGALQGQVRKPVAASAPTVRTFADGTDRQYNASTGTWDVIAEPSADKSQTEGQLKANTFADRLIEAETVLKDSDNFGSMFAVGGVLPNVLKSEDRQKFEQAQRNFINAVLRRESGAVISEEEFDNARKQYFPQPGDSSGVLSQKRMNRNTVINGFYREANTLRPAQPGDIIESDGVRYKVGDDGETLIEI